MWGNTNSWLFGDNLLRALSKPSRRAGVTAYVGYEGEGVECLRSEYHCIDAIHAGSVPPFLKSVFRILYR